MINLKKGETAVIKANSFTVGLGWDTKCDLDAHAYIYEGKSKTALLAKIFHFNDKQVDHVYFGNLRGCNRAVIHAGDNLTGIGDGDDEQIIINADKLPDKVNRICFKVNIYSGAVSFVMVKGAYIRIVDNRTNEEICRYKLNTISNLGKTCTFGDLIKDNGDWFFKGV